uniref:NADH-ubiquinone oxidoreductase chain 6 n=1 Tax=Chloroniella peringueyi TaxID=1569772 RepID=A0A8K1T780_9NEOP|nr:NADH dehydrogenase subunit 6 [Chloroniella peringueyi]
MIKLMMYMNMLITWNFIQMNHPLAMGLILLLQTIMICLFSGLLIQTFWFSYILFLIMLGGMLVLFIYMTSLASNELFSISIKTLIINIIILMMIFLIMIFENSFSNYFNSIDSYPEIYMINENKIELIKLYNYPTMNLTILLINYLFLTLIIIVKLTNIYFGPLRQMN